ncbi:MAG: cyanophycin synthetase [Candidatus Paceibacterota bacterium]
MLHDTRKRPRRYDSLVSSLPVKLSELQNDSLREAMATLESRLQVIDKISDITFINDSRSTSVNATWFALESVRAEIILIMGGVERDNDYSQLQKLVRERVRAIVCLGKDTFKIQDALRDDVEIMISTGSMRDAVCLAYHLAKKR